MIKNYLAYISLILGITFSTFAKSADSLNFIEQSNTALKNYNYSSAILLVNKSILYKKHNFSSINLNIEYSQKGKIFKRQGILDSALYYYQLSEEELLKSPGDKNAYANILLDKGRIYKSKRDYALALQNFNKALIIFNDLNDILKIGTLKLNIGNVFKGLKKYDSALKNYNEAVSTYKKLNLTQKVASCYNNIGNLYRQNQNYDSAFFYLYKTVSLREKSDKIKPLGFIYHNLSNLHSDVGNYDSALFYINKSLQIKFKINNEFEIYSDYLTLGEIYNLMGDFKNSIYYYEQAILSDEIQNDIETITELNKLLADSYYHEHQYKKASLAYHNFITLNDSINKINGKSDLEIELVNYEILKDSLNKQQLLLQKEINEIEQNNIALNSKINKNNTTYLLVILGILILLGSLLYISFKKRLKETNSHKKQLEIQNNELKRTLISKEEKETLLKEIHHRVKNNLQIINSLIRLQSHYMTEKNYTQKLTETENRIRSMALVHEKLYQSENISILDAKSYIKDLCENIKDSYEINFPIYFKFEIGDMQYSIDTLIPIGLILNEIISNAMKYAFQGKEKGDIYIKFYSQCIDDKTVLIVSDDGIGADLTYEELSEDSLGMELINSLCEQLDGELELTTEDGFKYFFTFPELK